MRRLALAAALLALAACGTQPAAGTPASSPTADHATVAACAAIHTATGYGEDLDPQEMTTIGQRAAQAAAASRIAQAGSMLADRATLAQAAIGHPDEYAATMAMQAAALDLATACAEAGYRAST